MSKLQQHEQHYKIWTQLFDIIDVHLPQSQKKTNDVIKLESNLYILIWDIFSISQLEVASKKKTYSNMFISILSMT